MIRRLDGLIDAIADGLRTPGLKQKLETLEERKTALETQLAAVPPPAPRLHPNLAELYRRKVTELENALSDPGSRDEALTILRGLIERVDLHLSDDGFDVDFHGEIANLIALPSPSRRANIDHYRVSAKRVAGARNHRQLTPPAVPI